MKILRSCLHSPPFLQLVFIRLRKVTAIFFFFKGTLPTFGARLLAHTLVNHCPAAFALQDIRRSCEMQILKSGDLADPIDFTVIYGWNQPCPGLRSTWSLHGLILFPWLFFLIQKMKTEKISLSILIVSTVCRGNTFSLVSSKRSFCLSSLTAESGYQPFGLKL